MAHSRSARKRIRQNRRRRLRNRSRKSRVKTAVRAVLERVSSGADPAALDALYRRAASELDRAAKRRVIHPNAAARKKSRLARRIAAALRSAAPEPASPPPPQA